MVFQYARPLMPKQEKVYKSIKPMFKQGVWRIFVGDTVEILQGPESGLQGKVLAVIRDPRRPQVLVEGRNLKKKKVRLGVNEEDALVVTMEAPIHYSNVSLLDPVTGKPCSTCFMYQEDGTKVRVTRGRNASASLLPIPPEATPALPLAGDKDTKQEDVREVTFRPGDPCPFQIPEHMKVALHSMVEPVGEPDPSWHTYKAVQARRRQYLSDKWVEKKFMHSWAGEAAAAGGRAPPPTAAAAAALPALLGATSFAARGLLLCARQQHWRPDSAAWG